MNAGNSDDLRTRAPLPPLEDSVMEAFGLKEHLSKKTILEAEDELYKGTAQDPELVPGEVQVLRELEAAILEGNLHDLEVIINSYEEDKTGFDKIMARLKDALSPFEIDVNWEPHTLDGSWLHLQTETLHLHATGNPNKPEPHFDSLTTTWAFVKQVDADGVDAWSLEHECELYLRLLGEKIAKQLTEHK